MSNEYGLYKKFSWGPKLYIGVLIINVIIQSIVRSTQYYSTDEAIGAFVASVTLLSVMLVIPQYIYFKKIQFH